jgi:hypothetical protein
MAEEDHIPAHAIKFTRGRDLERIRTGVVPLELKVKRENAAKTQAKMS